MLGHALERYRTIERITPTALATELGCTLEALQWMSLCRRPVGASFAEQTAAVAQRFSVDRRCLVRVLRRVEVIDALTMESEEEMDSEDSAILLAARDRTREDENDS
ncbi:hypothetical protein [Myxococcus sp. Y35]|uniref:hypothetical protein n=1 Tax=Pseudomyxococcus flavus TaxID=3115648 RepID=UPI003CF55F7B